MGMRYLTDEQIAVILNDYYEEPRSASHFAFKYKVPISTMSRLLGTYFNLQTKQVHPKVNLPAVPENWQEIKNKLMQNGPDVTTAVPQSSVRTRPLPATQATTTTNPKLCIHCEVSWPKEDLFCRKCGTKLYTKSVLAYKAKLRELVDKVLVYIPPETQALALADFTKFDEELEQFDVEDS